MNNLYNNSKLSIVVINDSNKDLDGLIELLLNQVYKNIQIIVVGDEVGTDKRVKYVKRGNNKFLSGFNAASGDFITFIDSNDYVSIDYYRANIKNILDNNSDIVACNMVMLLDEKLKYEYPLMRLNFKELVDDNILDEFFKQRGYNYYWYSIWNKIYRIDLWKNSYKYFEKVNGELDEMFFSMVLFYFAKKLTITSIDSYFHFQNEDYYLIKEYIDYKINDTIKSFSYAEKFLKDIKLYDKYVDYLNEWRSVCASIEREKVELYENVTVSGKKELLKEIDNISNENIKKCKTNYLKSIKTDWDCRIEDIKKLIIDEKIKCISFDIFDTLILRPFYYPKDMFILMDDYFDSLLNSHSIDFSKMRVSGEVVAREKKYNNTPSLEDVTLDEIYDAISEVYGVSDEILNSMKNKEIEMELRFCVPRKTVHELYELALFTNKKVICTSDMYLPKNVIEKMLKKCGYDIKDIYVSSDIMKTKDKGSLYEYIIDKTKLLPEEIIHVGDNYNVDFLNPKKYGINSIFLLKTIDSLFYSNNLIKMFNTSLPFWEDNRAGMNYIGVRVMLAMVANKYFDNPYRSFNKETDFNADPYLIGYYALGAYNYAITKWLLDNTNGVDDKIAFMARDGYLSMNTYEILKKIYDKPAESVYMYASRKALIPVIISEKIDFFKLIEIFNYSSVTPKKVFECVKNIVVVTEDKLIEECRKNNIKYNEKFGSIKELNIFLGLVSCFYDKDKHLQNRIKLKKYFDDILGNRTAVFDVGYSGRPEYYLSNFCNKKIDTYFLNINTDECLKYSKLGNYDLKTFFSFKPVLTGNAYELLLSKNAPSCVSYDFSSCDVKPVFGEFDNNYILRCTTEIMQNAAIEFTSDMYNTFKDDLKKLYYQDYYFSLPIMAYFNSSEALDREVLGSIIFDDDIGRGIDKRMIDDMERERKSKNQLLMKELVNIKEIIKDNSKDCEKCDKIIEEKIEMEVKEEVDDSLEKEKLVQDKEVTMSKYIHYCWFGNKPLPKLAKKCIKSWKKYLPDYEIIKWSEDNVDLKECPFVEGAYKSKKWAFVADYFRCKALKEMGGIYFDTDMEVIKDITKLLDDKTFLGIEDSGYVAVGVWYEKEKNGFLPNKLVEKYKSFKEFDESKMSEVSIPKLISGILDEYGLVKGKEKVQRLKDDIVIYPRDYFYPYSYNRDNNIFTNNTCMIHYYDASWIPFRARVENNMIRKFGRDRTITILNTYRKGKDGVRKIGRKVLSPVIMYRNHKKKVNELKNPLYLQRIDKTVKEIREQKEKKAKYITFYNGDWLGVTSATRELFTNLVDCGEILSVNEVVKIGKEIIDGGFEQVVFSPFVLGWKDLAVYLKSKKSDIKLKTFWHGSHSQIYDEYGFERNREIIELHKKGVIDVVATCKKSLLNFYNKEGYNSFFLANKSTPINIKNKKETNTKEIKIGIYAAKCDDWRKNMYSQIAAISTIKNATIDMVPLNDMACEFCNLLGVKITGTGPLSHSEMLKRMSMNSINLYVTYSECAPMLPLESMEMGVICITGNNHHYFENKDLKKYLVVDNEEDILEIKDKILYALENKDKILKMYKEFSKENEKIAKEKVNEYLNK